MSSISGADRESSGRKRGADAEARVDDAQDSGGARKRARVARVHDAAEKDTETSAATADGDSPQSSAAESRGDAKSALPSSSLHQLPKSEAKEAKRKVLVGKLPKRAQLSELLSEFEKRKQGGECLPMLVATGINQQQLLKECELSWKLRLHNGELSMVEDNAGAQQAAVRRISGLISQFAQNSAAPEIFDCGMTSLGLNNGAVLTPDAQISVRKRKVAPVAAGTSEPTLRSLRNGPPTVVFEVSSALVLSLFCQHRLTRADPRLLQVAFVEPLSSLVATLDQYFGQNTGVEFAVLIKFWPRNADSSSSRSGFAALAIAVPRPSASAVAGAAAAAIRPIPTRVVSFGSARVNAATRAELAERAAKHGWPALIGAHEPQPNTASDMYSSSSTDGEMPTFATHATLLALTVPAARVFADAPPRAAGAASFPDFVIPLEPLCRSIDENL